MDSGVLGNTARHTREMRNPVHRQPPNLSELLPVSQSRRVAALRFRWIKRGVFTEKPAVSFPFAELVETHRRTARYLSFGVCLRAECDFEKPHRAGMRRRWGRFVDIDLADPAIRAGLRRMIEKRGCDGFCNCERGFHSAMLTHCRNDHRSLSVRE